MTDNQWKTVFAVVAAVCSFVLAQPDVAVPPIAKVVLGAIIVALAVVNPNRSDG